MSERFAARVRAAAALGLAATLFLPLHAQPQPQEKFRQVQGGIPDQYIVVLDDRAAGPRGRLSRAGDVAGDLARLYGGQIRFVYRHALNGFAAEMPEGVARAMSLDPRVVSLSQVVPVELFDTQFNPPWGLDRIDQRNRPLDNAYSFSNTGGGVTAYVIDTGIRTSHAEFGGRASVGADFIGDGQNGQDCHGHGTHVAGSIGGSTYGVAKGARLVAVRVFNCVGGGGTSAVIIAAVDWVTANRTPPAVANMSLGGGPDPNMDAAVRNSIAAGVTYVVAAGNADIDASNVSPARVVEAITIGATDINDVRATWDAGGRSNYGSVLDLFAPGKGILSAWYTSDTATAILEGTSMATPHVAGVAARYLQTNPGAAPFTVADAINGNATSGVVSDPGPGSPNRLVFTGFLDPPPPPPPPPPPSPDTLLPGEILNPGQSRTSADGRFTFIYQGDGNLVLYRWDGVPLWASNTAGTSAGQTIMQTDGNLVIYDAGGTPVWSSGTWGNPNAYLIVQNDGNTVIYSSGGVPLWSTGTCCL